MSKLICSTCGDSLDEEDLVLVDEGGSEGYGNVFAHKPEMLALSPCCRAEVEEKKEEDNGDE